MTDPDTSKLALEVGLIGAVAAVVGGLLSGAYQHLRDWLIRPVLKFEFKECSANDLQSPYMPHATWAEVAGGEQHDWLVIRASLHNLGRRTAKHCRVFLIDLNEVHDSKNIIPADFHDSVSLPWAGWDFTSRDAVSSAVSFVDVVRFRKDVGAWNFPFLTYSNNQASLTGYSGVYHFRMVATADNADPAYCEIRVAYEKDWHGVRAWRVS